MGETMTADSLLADGCLTVTRAVAEYGVGRTRLYEMMGRGELAYSQIGGRRLIPRVALRRVIASGLVGVAAEAVQK